VTIEVKVTDRVTIQCPIPATKEQTVELTRKLDGYVSEDYIVVSSQAVEGGSQRDPYVIGFKLTLERK